MTLLIRLGCSRFFWDPSPHEPLWNPCGGVVQHLTQQLSEALSQSHQGLVPVCMDGVRSRGLPARHLPRPCPHSWGFNGSKIILALSCTHCSPSPATHSFRTSQLIHFGFSEGDSPCCGSDLSLTGSSISVHSVLLLSFQHLPLSGTLALFDSEEAPVLLKTGSVCQILAL